MNPTGTSSRRPRASNVVLLLAGLIVLVAGLKAAQGFFVPVLLAFFIATVSFPITNWLRNKKVPRGIAVMLTVIVDFAFLTGLVFLAVSALGDLQSKWESQYRALTVEKVKGVAESVADAEDWFRSWGDVGRLKDGEPLPSDEDLREAPRPNAVDGGEIAVEDREMRVAEVAEDMVNQFSGLKISQIWDLGTGLVGRMVSFFGTALVVIILTIFMLTEARMFGRRMDSICEARGPNLQRMMSALRDTQRYLGIKTAVSLATGVLAGALCWAAKLDFWPLWGILAFALNYVPVVGSVIAGVPPTLLALLVDGPPTAVAVMGGYFLINTFLGNFIEPMLMGRRFGLSTLVVLVSVMFWGWLWGPLGMLLAVPLTMVVKVLLDNSEEFRWVAVAIGKESPRPSEEKRILSEAAGDAPEAEIVQEPAKAVGRS